MKKWFFLLFFFLVGAFLFWQKDYLLDKADYLFHSPCERPITYRIGTVDLRYQLSQLEFKNRLQEATDVWRSVYGWDLFEYDPQSPMAVNLIYSESQYALEKVGSLQEQLEADKSDLEQRVAEYEGQVADFERRLQEFNQKVLLWNQRGGAPMAVYEAFIKEQKELEAESERLNQLARELNLTTREYNIQVGEFNESVQDYNLLVQQKPEAGLYDGTVPKIDIYITTSKKELIHTLAHELGHALGLGHVDGALAIMYPFSSETIDLSRQDVALVQEFCSETVLEKLIRMKKEAIEQYFLLDENH